MSHGALPAFRAGFTVPNVAGAFHFRNFVSVSTAQTNPTASKQDAQGYGSALTYARRYGILTLCGIAPEDDDGNAASKPATYKAPARPTPRLTDEISEPINRSTKPKSNGKAPVAAAVGSEAEEEALPWD